MRIANNHPLPRAAFRGARAAFFIALGVLSVSSGAYAEGTIQLAAAQPVTAPQAANLPVGDPPATSATEMPAPSIVLPSDGSSAQGASVEKDITAMEDKVVENAKSVVKHLDVASDTMTLADLNRARQTVSRIDAMIDVEKRLNELEKIRSERHGSHQALEGAIPASALVMPPMSVSPSKPVVLASHEEEPVRHVETSRPEISRIYGAGGKYTAVLSFSGGDVKSVHVGDKLADGETVRAITSSFVEIGGKETSYTLRVKNVDVVYSAER